MKIIPKIALYAAMILFLSISLGEKDSSKAEPPGSGVVVNRGQMRMRVTPYGMSGKAKVESLIYIKKITLNSNLVLDH
jgi:hypothetical protein